MLKKQNFKFHVDTTFSSFLLYQLFDFFVNFEDSYLRLAVSLMQSAPTSSGTDGQRQDVSSGGGDGHAEFVASIGMQPTLLFGLFIASYVCFMVFMVPNASNQTQQQSYPTHKLFFCFNVISLIVNFSVFVNEFLIHQTKSIVLKIILAILLWLTGTRSLSVVWIFCWVQAYLFFQSAFHTLRCGHDSMRVLHLSFHLLCGLVKPWVGSTLAGFSSIMALHSYIDQVVSVYFMFRSTLEALYVRGEDPQELEKESLGTKVKTKVVTNASAMCWDTFGIALQDLKPTIERIILYYVLWQYNFTLVQVVKVFGRDSSLFPAYSDWFKAWILTFLAYTIIALAFVVARGVHDPNSDPVVFPLVQQDEMFSIRPDVHFTHHNHPSVLKYRRK